MSEARHKERSLDRRRSRRALLTIQTSGKKILLRWIDVSTHYRIYRVDAIQDAEPETNVIYGNPIRFMSQSPRFKAPPSFVKAGG